MTQQLLGVQIWENTKQTRQNLLINNIVKYITEDLMTENMRIHQFTYYFFITTEKKNNQYRLIQSFSFLCYFFIILTFVENLMMQSKITPVVFSVFLTITGYFPHCRNFELDLR